MNQELANAIIVEMEDKNTIASPGHPGVKLPAAGSSVIAGIFFKKIDGSEGLTGLSAETVFESGKWGTNGANYVDGYTTI